MSKNYSLYEAHKTSKIPISVWNQGVQYGLVASVVRQSIDDGKSSRVLRHFISQGEYERFCAYIRSGGKVATSTIKKSREIYNATLEDIAIKAARESIEDRLEDRLKAKRLGMSLDEYREILSNV